ncbi:MAG: DUF1987 domain-containing protein [Gammaproteobacteria bacterium]|jgi:hypothetical protein|nr:DUF1987 domain-containing protein [Gammaproteobacteria bacterium]MBT3725533.1 DUF1987 domain-containing protein [Gammaproteobacteria bacterium]MBT4193944.1 DUF1987 domain-containing protein [Gammaproteobacteria bacterium]MBT4448849.1 DUF1987 domain-containing protein [Gammaproteobacteria bacterium]MBT4860863.1 DUF1987 domain-containing protein [Gammaproteobacteria bacterium]
MDTLEIIATKSSPEINFNAQTNVLSIVGESYPENTAQFYEPVFEWLDIYLTELSEQQVTVNMELIYFNSSSSKALMDIFDILEEASDDGKNIVLNWIYDEENDAALEYGEEFAEDIETLTFNLVEK